MGISKEYAMALFSLGVESGAQTEIYSNLAHVAKVFEDAPQLADYLLSPGIPRATRLQTLKDAFEGDTHEYVVSFLSLLCEHKDIDILSECIVEYNKLYEQNKNLSHALVKSAEPLTDEEKAKLIAKLEKVSGKSVDAEYRIDKSILGGVVVEMEGTIIDGSLKHRLESVKEVITR